MASDTWPGIEKGHDGVKWLVINGEEYKRDMMGLSG